MKVEGVFYSIPLISRPWSYPPLRLISIELHGFKSFPDTYKLMFKPGMTGVVGPNGCGKSNIGDWISWALGEQRPTVLRSSEMSEVIFAGTIKRKAMGFAEVKVLMEMPDQSNPSIMKEISISRRLYRDSNSEYRIDGKESRLRDIQNLLMDTGMGTRAYSYIQQGQIDLILNKTPQDRRSLIEEAAGITRYKVRKIEAERRLDDTRANLVRLDDVIHELSKQMGSLKRQAAQAKKAAAIDSEIEKFQRILLAGRWQDIEKARRDIQKQRDEIERQVGDLTAQVADKVSAVEGLKAALERQQHSQNERGRSIMALDQRLSLNEQEKKFQIQFQEEAKVQRQRLSGRLEELGIRQLSESKMLAELESQLVEANKSLEDKEALLRISDEALTLASGITRKLELDLEEIRSQKTSSQNIKLTRYQERLEASNTSLQSVDENIRRALESRDILTAKDYLGQASESLQSEIKTNNRLLGENSDAAIEQDSARDSKIAELSIQLATKQTHVEELRNSNFKTARDRDASWARRDAIQTQYKASQKTQFELDVERKRLIKDEEDFRIKSEQAVVRVAEIEVEVQNLLIQREEFQKELTDYQPILETEAEQLKDLERGTREFQEVLDNARNLRTDIVVKATEINGFLDTLSREIEIAFRMDPQAFIATISEEERNLWKEGELFYQTQITELQSKRMDIGTVNALAVEELETSESRLTDMIAQRQDVTEAIKNLELTIDEINETSKARFKEAFDFINEKFKEVFVDLFGGGTAKLTLDETEDILDCGIEIMAQPPGKTPKTINLLSGGEKALAAISLLFAIFHFKPSPFCILDEVDAALDQVKTKSFAELVKKMSKQTQFIVITHQTSTMVECDSLYGVTHYEPGCSQIVSVEFAEAKKIVDVQ